jgi:hypothetical protein
VLGVSPDAESEEIKHELEQSGYTVALELHGLRFSALSAVTEDGAPAKVRAITGRGIALALEPIVGTPLQPAVAYALLPPPSKDTHDADGDGFEELFVHRFEEGEAPCILVYRVRDSGFVDAVASGSYAHAQPAGAPPWDAPNFCADVAEPEPAQMDPRTDSPDAGSSRPPP